MDKTFSILKVQEVIPRLEHIQFSHPITWNINNDEHWAIIGPNGSGKTILTDILTGKYVLKSGSVSYADNKDSMPVSSFIKSVAFKDIYSIIDTHNSYYQQRWNKGDEQETPLVRSLVARGDAAWLEELIEWFKITDLMDKEVNLLSSGELRKSLIVRSLLSRPRILILDNPFIGLDTESRAVLNRLFSRLANLDNLQVILVLSNPDDIPDIITHVLPIKNKKLYNTYKRIDFLENKALIDTLFNTYTTKNLSPLKSLYKNTHLEFNNAVLMRNIHIKYDSRTILKDLDWQIKRGEKWALLGVNGAGKSTLLSLIYGDNPQAYANDITLFDRKRGSGESIWDIKKRIGYISPEMHLYYLKNVRSIDVVSSGFFDTIGLYQKCSREQENIALQWMELFGISHIKDVSFLNISSGEQRLVLLARVFVKNPDLLILDEPLHGLDISNKKLAKKIIEQFCDKDKSLIYVTHYENEIPDIINHRLILTKIK